MKRQEIKEFIKENKNFKLLWISQILSQITINMITFVMATRIYEKTGSTVAVSFLWFFLFLPGFFLGPFSGYFIDRWSLRKTLLVTNFIQGMTIFLFLFIGHKIYLIYPIVFLYSLLNQFYGPAEAAFLPWLVKKEGLKIANSLFVLTSQGALIFGLDVSGILMTLFGKNNPVWISAISLLTAAVAVYFLPKNEPKKIFHKNSFSRFLKETKFGYSFIKNSKIILFPIVLMVFLQIFLTVIAITIPNLSRDILNMSMQHAGPILVVPAGLGALIGVYLMNRFGHENRKSILMKFGFGLALFVLSFIAVALPYLGIYRYWLIVPLMLLFGISIIFITVPNQTLVQENTPPILRGRVYAAWGFFANVLVLPSILFSSTIVDIIGVRPFFILAALFLFTIVLFFDKMEGFILSKEESIFKYFANNHEIK